MSFSNHRVYGILLEQPEWTKMGSATGAFVQRDRVKYDEGMLSQPWFSGPWLAPSYREDSGAHRPHPLLGVTELASERAGFEPRHSDLTHIHALSAPQDAWDSP